MVESQDGPNRGPKWTERPLSARFAEMLSRHMMEKGLTLAQVAGAVWNEPGRTSHVAAYMKGTKGNPSRRTVARFAAALGWDAEVRSAIQVGGPLPEFPEEFMRRLRLAEHVIQSLVWEFGYDDRFGQLADYQDFLLAKAEEHRAMRTQLERIRSTRFDQNALEQATLEFELANYEKARIILEIAVEKARFVTKESIRETASMLDILSRLSLQENEPERSVKYTEEAARMLFLMSPDEASRLIICQAERLEKHGEQYGDGGFAASEVLVRTGVEMVDQHSHPREWAGMQNRLSSALLRRGERTSGSQREAFLAEALTACEAAAKVTPQERFPEDWAQAKNNQGNCLLAMAAGLRPSERRAVLTDALKAYRSSLSVRTKDNFPVLWARVHINLSVVFRRLAECSSGRQMRAYLVQAIAAAENSLEIDATDEDLFSWAASNFNCGTAWRLRCKHTKTALFHPFRDSAVRYYAAALKVFTEEKYPYHWAWTRFEIGLLLELVGDRLSEEPERAFSDATDAFEDAFRVFGDEYPPFSEATCQEAIARVRARMDQSQSNSKDGRSDFRT